MNSELNNSSEQNQEQHVGNVKVDGYGNIVTFSQTQIIQISVDEVKTRPFNIKSPYKSLKKFESEDKNRFFGRDQFLTQLANQLEQTNLILLMGASGRGSFMNGTKNNAKAESFTQQSFQPSFLPVSLLSKCL